MALKQWVNGGVDNNYSTAGNWGCQLLLHGDGTNGSTTITDSSTTPHTMTANGNAQITTTSPKFGTGSILFDGAGDYVSTPDSADFAFGAGDFTIDFWVNYTNLPTAGNYQCHIGQWNSLATDDGFITLIHNTAGSYTYEFFYTTDGATYKTGSFATTPSTATWYHVAFVRSGTGLYCFVNGTQQGSTYNIATDNLRDSSIILTIGTDNNASHLYPLDAKLDELRVIKGTAVWTSAFTPPTQAYSVGVPTASDDVVTNNANVAMTVDVNSVAKTFDSTGYTNTLTHNAFSLTVSGSVTFGSGMTYSPSTSTSCVLIMNASGTLTSNGKAFNNVYNTGGTLTLGDNLTFVTTVKTSQLQVRNAMDLNGKTVLGGSATSRVLVNSATVGTAKTITINGGTFANADFKDITASTVYDASAITGGSGDCGGNSNITFTTATSRYAVASGSVSNTAIWASSSGGTPGASVPLPQDSVFLDGSSGVGTITQDMPRFGKDIDMTNYAGTFTLGIVTSIFGNWTSGSSMTWSGASALTLEGRGSQTFKSNGVTMPAQYAQSAFGGTYTLQDSITNTSTSALFVQNGTFNANGFSVTALKFNSNVSSTRTITMGSGTWTATSSGTIWDFTTTTGLTFNANSSTISITDTSASSKTFIGGSKIFNNLSITGGGSGAIIIQGSNTFSSITINKPKTVTFTSSTTQQIGSITATGSVGNIITLNASSAGTAATLNKTGGGIVNLDFLDITDVNVTPTKTWYYGNNSTYHSGTGWNAGVGSTGDFSNFSSFRKTFKTPFRLKPSFRSRIGSGLTLK